MPRTVVSAVAWFVAAAEGVASWRSSCGECGSASSAARPAASAARAGLAPGTAPDAVSVPDCAGAALEDFVLDGAVLDGAVLDGTGVPAGAVAVPEPVVPPPWVAGTVAVAGVPTRAGCAVGAAGALNPDETTWMAAAEPPAMKRTASAAAAATAAPPLDLIRIAQG